MTRSPSTRAVRLTPEGRGGISTVLVAGPQATAMVDRLFVAANRRPLGEQSIDRIIFGRFHGGEELIVCRRGPQRVEVHCHGGQAAADAVLRLLGGQGATVEGWKAWVQHEAEDRLAAEAWQALAQATTLPTALVLLDQFHGALRRELDAAAQAAADGNVAGARLGIDALLGRARLGLHLVRPFRVVLAGEPNVGKSSLVNRILGYHRAITSGVPGTTRDIVTATTALNGWPVELSDTAGLHDTTSELEGEGIRRAKAEINAADLVIWVHDATTGSERSIAALAGLRVACDAITVLNKADLLPIQQRREPADWYVSAASLEGVDRLIGEIGRRLVGDVPPAGSGVPFLDRHVQALMQARQMLAEGASGQDWRAWL